MAFFRQTFGQKYQVFSDIYINGDGIHDGFVLHPWHDMKACDISESNREELKRFFGEEYEDRPYAIYLTHNDGTCHNITLFGQGLDKVIEVAKAINHFSGREFISMEKLEGKPLSVILIIGLIAFTAAMAMLAVIH